MRTCTIESNEAHRESQAVYDNFIANGGKITKPKTAKRAYIKGTINKPTPNKQVTIAKASLADKTDLEKVAIALKAKSPMTRQEISLVVGIHIDTVSRKAAALISDKMVIRINQGAGNSVVFAWIGD